MDAPPPRIALFCDAASLSLLSVMGTSALVQASGIAPPRPLSWTLMLAMPFLAGVVVGVLHAGRSGPREAIRVLAWWLPALAASGFVLFVLANAVFGAFVRWVFYAVIVGVEVVALYSAAACVLARRRGETPPTPVTLDAVRVAGVIGFVVVAFAWFFPRAREVSGQVSFIGLSVPVGLAVASGLAVVLSKGSSVTPRR